MGYRAHVQTKHVVEYGDRFFNHDNEAVNNWLSANGVEAEGAGDFGENPEWEISKEQLRAIPESAYAPEEIDEIVDGFFGNVEAAQKELRSFVKSLLDAPTGDIAYVSWF